MALSGEGELQPVPALHALRASGPMVALSQEGLESELQ